MEQQHHEHAVSRAYYFAFHAAQSVLTAEGQSADTHEGVVTLFGLLLVKPGKIDKKCGKILANLKTIESRATMRPFRLLTKRQRNGLWLRF